MVPEDWLDECMKLLQEQNSGKRIKRFSLPDGFYEAKVRGSDFDFYDDDFYNFILLEINGVVYAFDFDEKNQRALKWISHLSDEQDPSLHFDYYIDSNWGTAVGNKVVVKIKTDYSRKNTQLSNRVIDFNILPKSLYDFYGY